MSQLENFKSISSNDFIYFTRIITKIIDGVKSPIIKKHAILLLKNNSFNLKKLGNLSNRDYIQISEILYTFIKNKISTISSYSHKEQLNIAEVILRKENYSIFFEIIILLSSLLGSLNINIILVFIPNHCFIQAELSEKDTNNIISLDPCNNQFDINQINDDLLSKYLIQNNNDKYLIKVRIPVKSIEKPNIMIEIEDSSTPQEVNENEFLQLVIYKKQKRMDYNELKEEFFALLKKEIFKTLNELLKKSDIVSISDIKNIFKEKFRTQKDELFNYLEKILIREHDGQIPIVEGDKIDFKKYIKDLKSK